MSIFYTKKPKFHYKLQSIAKINFNGTYVFAEVLDSLNVRMECYSRGMDIMLCCN